MPIILKTTCFDQYVRWYSILMNSYWPLRLFLALVIMYSHTATIIQLQINGYKINRIFYIENTSSFAPSLYGIHTNRCLKNINKKIKKSCGGGGKSLKPTQDKKVYSLKSPTSPFWRLSRSYALYRQAGHPFYYFVV